MTEKAYKSSPKASEGVLIPSMLCRLLLRVANAIFLSCLAVCEIPSCHQDYLIEFDTLDSMMRVLRTAREDNVK
jgi:hypothetical protein